jgi:HAD superfamily hydrolase (TIGR01549 family)
VVDCCIKTVFFDLGQTLVELSSLKLCMYDSLMKNLTQFNPDFNELMYKWGYKTHELFVKYREKDFIDIIEMHILGLKNVLENYEINIPNRLVHDMVDDVWYNFIENNNLYPNARNVLEKLIKSGYKLGLITNSELFIVNGILQKHNLIDFFDVKVISGVVKAYKPNPILFEIAIELGKCTPGEGIYIGDSEIDIKGAKKVGLITVIICRNEIPEQTIGLKPNYRINSLLELPDLISKINKYQTLGVG